MSMFDWLRNYGVNPEAIEDVEATFDTPAPIVPDAQGVLDTKSDTWIFIQAHLTQELSTLREKNDSSKHDATATAELRGQIKMVKRLLALGLPKADKRRQTSVDED